MPAPLISIIVPCKNAARSLERCLRSIIGQGSASWELIVVDGGSTDQTTDLLEAHRHSIAKWVVGPDQGVYDAMNKGARQAGGEWLLFLGADDQLHSPDTLSKISPLLASATEGLVCGTSIYTDGRTWPASPNANPRYRNFLHHQACFYRRTLFAEKGYDITLKLQADYDFNLRQLAGGGAVKRTDIIIATCGAGGLSDSGRWLNYREEIMVRHRYFSAAQCWLYDAGSILRYLRKSLLRSASKRPE
jgi:glycosyltransferase involved in cell wall biosynthesis